MDGRLMDYIYNKMKLLNSNYYILARGVTVEINKQPQPSLFLIFTKNVATPI